MHGQSKLSPNQTGQYFFFYHGFLSQDRTAEKGIGPFISTDPQTSRHLVTEVSTAYF